MTQADLFIANIKDVKTKHARELMERNWASLSKQARHTEIKHVIGDNHVTITGQAGYGIATIWDHDILLFLISQMTAAQNQGAEITTRQLFTGYDFNTFVRKHKLGGSDYEKLWDSLNRLHFTHVQTSIRRHGKRDWAFNWLSDVRQEIDENGKHRGYTVSVAEWLVDAVRSKSLVLTLDEGYFGLKGGLERWIYLWCRKAAGHQKSGWIESFESLWYKSASQENKKQFTRRLRNIIKKHEGRLLGYHIEEVIVHRRPSLSVERIEQHDVRELRRTNKRIREIGYEQDD